WHFIESREARNERSRLGLRIAVETGFGFVVDKTLRPLVGVQAREGGIPQRVFIRSERQDVRSDKRLEPAHEFTLEAATRRAAWESPLRIDRRRVIERACPSRPSSSASAT